MKGCFEAIAEYADGSTLFEFFEQIPNKTESEQQYEIESWLIEQHSDCVWYKVKFHVFKSMF